MFNCQDARMACYIVFQSALKLLIVEFARIFYTNIYAKLSDCSKLAYGVSTMHENTSSSRIRFKRDVDNQFTWYWTSHASTRTRYLDILKVCWLLNLIAGLYRSSKYTMPASDIPR